MAALSRVIFLINLRLNVLPQKHSSAPGILPTPSPYNPTFLKNVVWAFPFSLAATQGMRSQSEHFFLFLRLLRCFTSAGLPSSHRTGLISLIAKSGFPIRKSPDQRLLNTFPRLIAVTPRPSSP